MIHISKTEHGQFYAIQIGDNPEPLNTTESEVAKQSIWKNLKAVAKQWSGFQVVQDDTVRGTPKVYIVDKNGKRPSTFHNPVPRYVKGKNPKRKTRTK